ncbi:MAG: thermonuclease family protein [Robiginitomaculum sp.]|nr:thermonuclease family protein [Robiginitomaculum sp.]
MKNPWQNYFKTFPVLVILLGANLGTLSLANDATNYPETRMDSPAPQSATAPAYTYRANLTKVYDADSWRADVDLGFNTWRRNEPLRLYGIDAPEIKRSTSKGITGHDVKHGFDCRDIMLGLLGLSPEDYPRKAKFIDINPPVPVIIETIKDKQGKYGRMLAIIHKGGVNLNEKLLQSGCARVEFYEG